MARSGLGAPGWRVVIVWVGIALLLGGCGVPDEFPTPTPTPRVSPTPTTAPTPRPTPTVASTSTAAPENPTAATTPTVAVSPSPLSLRPTATTQPSPTATTQPTPPSDSDAPPNQTIPGTATAFAPGPGPVATVVALQPEATSTGVPVATVEPTVVPLPTATPTLVPEPTPTPTPTATLIPEPTPTPELCPGAIPWYDAINYLGSYATVIGPVVAAYWAEEARGKPTFLNMGVGYPDPSRFTVLIWIDGRWNFDYPPEETYLGLTICVTGTIELYEGSAEMLVEGPGAIWVP